MKRNSAAILSARSSLLSQHQSELELDLAIQKYLSTLTDGHVWMESKYSAPKSAVQMDVHPRFAQLDQGIAWITIPSFNVEFRDAIIQLLSKASVWVIDLRSNRGGSDDSYTALLPYVMSGDYQVDGMTILSSSDNILAWEKLPKLYPQMSEQDRNLVAQVVAKMRANPDQQISLDGFQAEKITPAEFGALQSYPRRVLVLQSRTTASSAEEFLLAARQSNKVTTIGENSAGVLDYANVREFPLPSGQRNLWLATTRSSRVTENRGIDGVGIEPKFAISAEVLNNNQTMQEWIKHYLAE